MTPPVGGLNSGHFAGLANLRKFKRKKTTNSCPEVSGDANFYPEMTKSFFGDTNLLSCYYILKKLRTWYLIITYRYGKALITDYCSLITYCSLLIYPIFRYIRKSPIGLAVIQAVTYHPDVGDLETGVIDLDINFPE
jgi:hypothetical protein